MKQATHRQDNNGKYASYGNNINFPTSDNYLVAYRVASVNGGGRLSPDLDAGSMAPLKNKHGTVSSYAMCFH